MDDYFVITLRILGRVYRLKIKRSDEKKYRDAAVAIEKKTTQYRNFFSENDSENLLERDYLAMTTIQALTEYVELEDDNLLFESKISSMIDEIDSYLKKSQ